MKIPKKGDVMFGITFLKETERNSDNRRKANFRCYCGKEFNTGIYQIINGLTQSCGCKNGEWNRQLTKNQVLVIRHHIWNDGLTLREIGEKFNVSLHTIYNIKIEKTYKNVA